MRDVLMPPKSTSPHSCHLHLQQNVLTITCIFKALSTTDFLSFTPQSNDAACPEQQSTRRRTVHKSTVPGRALVKRPDTLKEAIHQPVVFFGRASSGSAGESVMLWLPFIKRQGYCGSGSTGAAAINKQTKQEP